MAHVQFTKHLRRYFPKLEDGEYDGETVAALVSELDRKHKGLASYLTDERGALRQHVNIYVEEELVADKTALSDRLTPSSRVFVMQALSGG